MCDWKISIKYQRRRRGERANYFIRNSSQHRFTYINMHIPLCLSISRCLCWPIGRSLFLLLCFNLLSPALLVSLSLCGLRSTRSDLHFLILDNSYSFFPFFLFLSVFFVFFHFAFSSSSSLFSFIAQNSLERDQDYQVHTHTHNQRRI